MDGYGGSKEKDRNEPFGDLMRSMNQLFHEKPGRGFLQTMDDFFKNPFPASSSFHVDVAETEKEHIISAELPGINKEQIQIDILDNYITISVKSSEMITEEDEKTKFSAGSKACSVPAGQFRFHSQLMKRK